MPLFKIKLTAEFFAVADSADIAEEEALENLRDVIVPAQFTPHVTQITQVEDLDDYLDEPADYSCDDGRTCLEVLQDEGHADEDGRSRQVPLFEEP